MSEEQAKKPPAESGGAGSKVVGILLPAILAGAAAFGGTKLGAAPHAPPPHVGEEPGPTVVLDPFIVTLADAGHPHVIKLTLAVELKHTAKAEEFKAFVPRIRDTTLSYLRALPYEEASSPARFEQLRIDLLERLTKLGIHDAEHVLVTEFVAQ
jgi:flagellar basal body-associated protein FliL